MTPDQRAEVMVERRNTGMPVHSVPHYVSTETTYYMVTAACFEHEPCIGFSADRMLSFEADLVAILGEYSRSLFAWVVLPNHYHALVDTLDIKLLLSKLGRTHGRTSFEWNGAEGKRGRQVWCNAAETAMKSDRHYYATLNYVLNNAVHHGYVARWQDWPYSNACEYLLAMGREKALAIWQEYPVLDYGASWDPPDI